MMLVTIMLIRAVLAAVFVASGAAKLTDTAGFATTLVGLGIPARRSALLRGISLAIPLAEMLVGLLVVSGFVPMIGNSLMLLLTGGFSIVVLTALWRGLPITCRCFGSLSDAQFSMKGLLRSLVLMALVGVVWWTGLGGRVQLNSSPGTALVLVVGYLAFGAVITQAARAVALLQERAIK